MDIFFKDDLTSNLRFAAVSQQQQALSLLYSLNQRDIENAPCLESKIFLSKRHRGLKSYVLWSVVGYIIYFVTGP